MKRIRLSPLLFRRIHKWVGLILGLQFLLWALSGSMMALLDKDKVGGHGAGMSHSHPLPAGAYADVAALRGDTGDVAPAEEHGAAVGGLEPREHAQRRRLATPRGAEE